MRVLLAAFGTRGDVQPLCALGLALRARGHGVTLAGSPDHQPFVEGLGLPFVGLGESMERFLARFSDGRGGLKLRAAMRALPPMLRGHFEWLDPLVQAADVVVAASLTLAHVTLAEKYGKRCHYVGYCPQLIPSAEHPAAFVKNLGFPGWLNRLTFWLGARAHDAMTRPIIDAERRRLGLGPSTGDAYDYTVFQRLILASDPALAPLPADCRPGREVHHTGAFFLPDAEPLGADLDAFVSAGSAPVYVGFGSMHEPNPLATAKWVVEAAERAGVRVVVAMKPVDLELPSWARRLDATSHASLFPRCAGIVHHGGAGTTAMAARSGVPQVVVPHAADQFFWANRLHRLGLAAGPTRKHDVEALATAMRACVEDEALRDRARAFPARMVLGGVDRAVAVIEGEDRPSSG